MAFIHFSQKKRSVESDSCYLIQFVLTKIDSKYVVSPQMWGSLIKYAPCAVRCSSRLSTYCLLFFVNDNIIVLIQMLLCTQIITVSSENLNYFKTRVTEVVNEFDNWCKWILNLQKFGSRMDDRLTWEDHKRGRM